MGIRVVPYTAEYSSAAAQFNQRLAQNAAMQAFALTLDPDGYRHNRGVARTEPFVAVDDEGHVRGGYVIQWYSYLAAGEVRQIGHYRAPISEGVVDRRYMTVGALMLKHAQSDGRLLFAMGMGGEDQPLPRILRAMGWQMAAVPFWFRVLRANPFLRNIGPLRRKPHMRMAADIAARTGTGALAIHAAQWFRTARRSNGFQAEKVSEFGDWADRLWERSAGSFVLGALRDSATLNGLYPAAETDYRRVRIRRGSEDLGWVVIMLCRPKNSGYFGDMKVAAIVDGIAVPGAVDDVIAAGLKACSDLRADLVFSNQSHADWTGALQRNGFWQGPSNYLLATCRAVNGLIGPLETAFPRIHFNRGDGDGRVNL